MEKLPSKNQTRILIGLGILGIISRIVLSAFSLGTNDATTWHAISKTLLEVDLYALYSLNPHHHQPPLISLILSYLIPFSQLTGLSFEFCLRLFAIASDTVCAILIFRIWNKKANNSLAAWAFCFFCWNPLSILISGYHGHTDPMCAVFVLLSLYFLGEKKSPLIAGLCFGASINIKLIPLLLIPPLLTTFRSKKEIGYFVLGIIPFDLPFLFGFIWGKEAFYRNIFQYNSIVDYWGFQTFLLLFYGNSKNEIFLQLSQLYHLKGRLLVLFLILLFTWFSFKIKKFNVYEIAALTLAIFFIFSPGFGVSYLTILLPILFAYSTKWGLKISAMGAVAAIVSYLSFLVSWSPLHSMHNSTTPKFGVLVNFFLWFTLILFLGTSFLSVKQSKKAQ